jgi:nucleoside-diphosphate-sugar epimerase
MQVLVTGATGLVGFEAVEQLRGSAPIANVVSTSRRGHSASDPAIIRWDIAAEEAPVKLRRSWDVIVHTAADTRWTMTTAQATAANVDTVAALTNIVSEDTHVIHISTAFAAGLDGDGESTDIGDYRNAYEWSKAHAERLARECFSRLTIVRPPLIIGRRSDGRAARFTGMYTVLRAMTASMVPAIVGVPDAHLDVIPVDALGSLLVEFATRGPQRAVVTVAGGSCAPTVRHAMELIAATLNDWRSERSLGPLEAPRVIDPAAWERFFRPFVEGQLSPRQARILELFEPFQAYLRVTQPLVPTRRVTDLDPAIAVAVRYWADHHPRQAALSPKPWQPAFAGAAHA